MSANEKLPPELPAWEAFVSATSAEGRCQAWLALMCGKIPGARAAAVLIENPLDHTFVPLAVSVKSGAQPAACNASNCNAGS